MWTINDVNYKLPNETFVVAIDAITQLGFDIPRFCYHEGLKVAGNCRMCLIEDAKAAKPLVSCAMSPSRDSSIFLNTVKVKKARESVMEFLLINHPLDCPICDQGGECDLQDLSMVYGSDHGRFYDYKRNVEDKNCGPIVKTVMNRCILCTRCVRFATDVARYRGFGVTGRGVKSEIGSYVERFIENDLSGNLIDICPVGALTSKPYSFAARPWELKRLFTINILDDEIQSIRVDIKENELLRIMPSKNDSFTNNWITNRTRFSYEGLKVLRESLPVLYGNAVEWVLFLQVILKVLIQLEKKIFLEKKVFSMKDNSMSNQDVILAKNFVNTFSLSYLGSNKSIFTLSKSYENILKDDAFLLVNQDLKHSTPILSLLIQQASKYVLAWNSLIESDENVFFLSGSLMDLIKAIRSKSWFSVIFPKKRILVDSFFAGLFKRYNPSVLYGSAFQRSISFFSYASRVNSQNSFSLPPLFSLSVRGVEKNSSDNDVPLLLEAATHISKNRKSLVMPISTFYEQLNLSYFDTSFKVFKTSRAIISSLKSHINLLKAFSSIFGHELKIFFSEDFFTFKRFICNEIRFIFLNKISPMLLKQNRSTKEDYYGAYPLTKNSPSLRVLELKNIYRNTR